MNFEAHWSPFTSNKVFNENPRLLKSAKGMYWQTVDNQQVLDMTAGLWCTNLGHGRERLAQAMYESAKTLDYAPSFSFGHQASFELAERLTAISPGDLNHVFFTNSGSESVDTALKMALAYHMSRGNGSKKVFIGRQRGYHGVNFGGTAAGGISSNSRAFGRWGNVDHLSDVLDLDQNAFSRGLPKHGALKANELETLIDFHGAENVAAVIVEPIQGAGGVIMPPEGYLKRIREICTQNNVLLIFDEVVCAFGRTGSFSAAQEFEITPDLMTVAKGLTSGCVPMGAVFCNEEIYQTVVANSPDGIEFFHGYTYSAHPIACAAALTCLDIYQEEDLFNRASTRIATVLEDALHQFKSLGSVVDVRNYGLLGAIQFDLESTDQATPGVSVFSKAWENGLMVRGLADCIVVSPPLIIDEHHVDEFVEKLNTSISQAL